MNAFDTVILVQVLILIVLAVIIGLVIYYKAVYDDRLSSYERRENWRTREGGYRNSGFTSFSNERNEGIDRDSEGFDEIEH